MNDDLKQAEQSRPGELSVQIDPHAELKTNHEAMLKEIRSWALWSLGLGAVHLISSGFLDSSWGILLILVGLASIYYKTAPMFIIYTVTLAWAALSNIASLNSGWMIFAVIQSYMAFRTFKDFRRFGKSEVEFLLVFSDGSIASQRAKKTFPWIGALLSGASIFGCIVYAVLTFVLVNIFGPESEPPAYYIFLIRMVEIIGVLGFSFSLASLLAKHTPKALSIIGLIVGSMMILLFIGLNIFLVFSA